MENLLVSEVGKSFLKILWESEKSIVLESEWLFLAPAINPCPGCSRQNCLQGGGCPAPGTLRVPPRQRAGGTAQKPLPGMLSAL